MNIEHESGENGGNGGSSCGFIALVAVGFPSCGRKGRLMWDSPWIRSSRQNFSKLFLIETPLTMWLWEFCICQLSTSNKSFVGLFKVAFKGSAIIVVTDNCWLEAPGVASGEVPRKAPQKNHRGEQDENSYFSLLLGDCRQCYHDLWGSGRQHGCKMLWNSNFNRT